LNKFGHDSDYSKHRICSSNTYGASISRSQKLFFLSDALADLLEDFLGTKITMYFDESIESDIEKKERTYAEKRDVVIYLNSCAYKLDELEDYAKKKGYKKILVTTLYNNAEVIVKPELKKYEDFKGVTGVTGVCSTKSEYDTRTSDHLKKFEDLLRDVGLKTEKYLVVEMTFSDYRRARLYEDKKYELVSTYYYRLLSEKYIDMIDAYFKNVAYSNGFGFQSYTLIENLEEEIKNTNFKSPFVKHYLPHYGSKRVQWERFKEYQDKLHFAKKIVPSLITQSENDIATMFETTGTRALLEDAYPLLAYLGCSIGEPSNFIKICLNYIKAVDEGKDIITKDIA
jgi:hypothetical protein